MKSKKKKEHITIKDELIKPFSIQVDSRQFTVNKEGSIMPEGYFTTLGSALTYIAKSLNLNKYGGSNLSIKEYINKYENVHNSIRTLIDK